MSVLRIAAARGLSRAVFQAECASLQASSELVCSLGSSSGSVQQQQQQQLSGAVHRPAAFAQPLLPFSLQSARHYSQCDCPTLGGPQPDIVVVEYDENEVDRFIALADAIEAAFPNIVVEGNMDGAGRPGAFEVKAASGQLLHSKISSGSWPDADAVVEALAAAAACDVTAGAAASASQ